MSRVSDALLGDTAFARNSNQVLLYPKYGGQFGLDQNADDKVDINDAMSAVSGKGGGLADVLGKLFGK